MPLGEASGRLKKNLAIRQCRSFYDPLRTKEASELPEKDGFQTSRDL